MMVCQITFLQMCCVDGGGSWKHMAGGCSEVLVVHILTPKPQFICMACWHLTELSTWGYSVRLH